MVRWRRDRQRKKKAREKYQTDDVAELQELLARMKADNEHKRKNYQAQLDTIESELAEVEQKFAPATPPPSTNPSER